MHKTIVGSRPQLPTAFGLLPFGLLLVVKHTEVAAPTDYLLRRHGAAQLLQRDAELLGDAELEQEPVVFGELSL